MQSVNPYAAPRAAGGLQAGPEPEQPLSLLAALNTGTGLYFRRFPTWAAIALAVWAPVELFVSYQEYYVLDPDDALGVFRWSLLAEGFLGIIAIGGTISVGAAALRGERRGWLAGLGDGLRGWPRIFSSRLIGGVVLVFALLAFVLPAIYVGVRLSLSDCAAILEGRAGTGALSRSMELTRGRFLVFLGLCIATVVPVVLAGIVLFIPLDLIPELDHWLVSAALSCLLDVLEPWMTLVFVAAYVQCRAEEIHAQEPIPADLAGPAA
jgi:hypothetical protein